MHHARQTTLPSGNVTQAPCESVLTMEAESAMGRQGTLDWLGSQLEELADWTLWADKVVTF